LQNCKNGKSQIAKRNLQNQKHETRNTKHTRNGIDIAADRTQEKYGTALLDETRHATRRTSSPHTDN
jgi:hypothetical protein